ncbi:MAG: XRE family transcriptional regulator [Caldilineaceae bacterium]|nr:XRE family transcriptional regulator [Caldilineaceae bacterium]
MTISPDRCDIVSFGYWVQQRRLALDLTRPALARQVSCSHSMIKKIERDERRPSHRLAALLADHLFIPDPDRQRFLAIARGEFVATPLSSPDLVSLPPFLLPSTDHLTWDRPPFVAREAELAQLNAHLASAMAGNGGIVLIAGEAGDGKTMLAQAFARRGQEEHPDLVVAGGNCNAYTGSAIHTSPFARYWNC